MRRGVVLMSATMLLSVPAFVRGVHAEPPPVDLAGRVTKLERALDNRGLLELLQQVDTLKAEVQKLRGEIENQNYALEQLRKTQKDSYSDSDRRLRALEQAQTGGMTGAPAAAPLPTLGATSGDSVAGTPSPESALQVEVQNPAVPSPTAPPAMQPGYELEGEQVDGAPAESWTPQPSSAPTTRGMPPDSNGAVPAIGATGPQSVNSGAAGTRTTSDDAASEAAYRDAFGLLKAGQYKESIAAFSSFLERYPNSQYGDNAQYWVAESHFVLREFEPAIGEYQKVLRNYPASKKLSHAMLKIGYSYQELGQLDQARAVLEDLKRRYPDSAAAGLADDRLKLLAARSGKAQ